MMPPVRVPIASPVNSPATTVAGHDGSTWRVITRMASVAQVMAAKNGMSNGDPVGEIERLDIGREHVKPRTIIPKREFDGLELGTVGEAAGVPGQGLRAVIVGVELVDREPVVGGRPKPHHQRRANERDGPDDLRIDGRRLLGLAAREAWQYRQGRDPRWPCYQRPTARLVPRRAATNRAGAHNPVGIATRPRQGCAQAFNHSIVTIR